MLAIARVTWSPRLETFQAWLEPEGGKPLYCLDAEAQDKGVMRLVVCSGEVCSIVRDLGSLMVRPKAIWVLHGPEESKAFVAPEDVMTEYAKKLGEQVVIESINLEVL